MAALSGISAVRPTDDTVLARVAYGATIAAGQPLYLDTSDNEHKLADSDDTDATATVQGISITPGVDGGQGYIARGGSIILVGTTMAVGTTYFLGSTAGEIIPEGDFGTGDRVTRLGTAETATQLKLAIENTGIAHA